MKKLFKVCLKYRYEGLGIIWDWHRRGNQEPGCDKRYGLKPVYNRELLKYVGLENDIMIFPFKK